MTNNDSLWNKAREQINSLKIQKPLVLQNPSHKSLKSFDQVFQRSKGTINQLMPTIKNIISNGKNVPQSVKLLDIYAQKLGFLPMGEIYQGSGTKYIGRIQDQTSKGEIFFKQFPKIDQQYIDSPDIHQNLTFKANKAISKWNQFIKSQAQLGNFLKQIQSQQGKKSMIFQLAKTSSKATDQLRMLSTLYYYYVDRKTPDLNILMLPVTQREQLIWLLRRKQQIKSAYRQSLSLITKGRKDLVDYIKNYHQYKVSTIKMTMNKSDFEQFTEILQSDIAYVPDQMIATPIKTNSKWYEIFKQKQGSWSSRIVTQIWDPDAPWFRAVDYLKKN